MITTTVTPADVAELAEILAEDVKAYADNLVERCVYSAYELRMIRWMLATAEVRHTDNMVMIRISRRGKYSTSAYHTASHLLEGLTLENRTDGLGIPFGAGGEIVEIRPDAWALKF